MGSAPDELQELKEHAEEASQRPELAAVSFTMAVLAVLLAIVSLAGHRAHTEEILLQNQITDQWNYYQAKNLRRATYEALVVELSLSDKETAAAQREKYQQTIERYGEEQKEIEGEARKLQAELGTERRRANRFDLGEALFEIALVITSITLLTRKRLFWGVGLLFGFLGIIAAVTGVVLH